MLVVPRVRKVTFVDEYEVARQGHYGSSFDLQLIVDKVACDGEKSVGVEWHVEVDGKPFPLSRGLSLATTNAEGKLERVVDIAEAPWRVVGLLIRPLLTAFGAGAAALGIGGLGYLIGT